MNKEKSWDIGDGFSRWSRGVSMAPTTSAAALDHSDTGQRTRLLFTLVRPEWFTYVAGCHIKHVRLRESTNEDASTVEVVRVFRPSACEGIAAIEGNPKLGVYALAKVARTSSDPNANAVAVHRAEPHEDVLLATLRGQPDYEYLAVQFTPKQELLIALTGVPHFTIFVWRWAAEELLIAVQTLEATLSTGIAISSANPHLWAEWSTSHLTFYELQEYTENSVTMTEIELPRNTPDLLYPDTTRAGEPYQFDILSVAWTHSGDLFTLGNRGGGEVWRVDVVQRQLRQIGALEEYADAKFTDLAPYDSSCLAAIGSASGTGVVLIFQVRAGKLSALGRISFGSELIAWFPNTVASKTSFYAITDRPRLLQSVSEGRIRSTVHLTDILLSQVQAATFIGRSAGAEPEFLAVVTQTGAVLILDAPTGNVFAEWSIPFIAVSIRAHPILPYVAVGSVNGYVYFIDVEDPRRSSPRIIHQVFLMRTVVDRLEWTCRGRFLIAADSEEGYLFLLHGFATTAFDYLDCAHVAGFIRALVMPWYHKDQRLQVLSNYHRRDEMPFLLNNFRLNTDYFELVSSQLIDTPVSSLAFSPHARFLYAFTWTTRKVGLVLFHDDLQAGSLKEPEVLYETTPPETPPLLVNHMLLVGDHLFAFGLNGYVHILSTPDSIKTGAHIASLQIIQTHLRANGGVRQGLVSIDGSTLLTFGFDNTIACVSLKSQGVSAAPIDWSALGYGSDFLQVIQVQRKHYAALTPKPDVGIIREAQDCTIPEGRGIIWELAQAEEHELEDRYRSEKVDMMEELGRIRSEVQELIEANEDTDEASERLPVEAFEINEEAGKDLEEEFSNRFTHLKIVLSALYDLRAEWIQRVKRLTYEQFATPICTISGFQERRTIQNYPQPHLTQAFLHEILGIKATRRLEWKLHRARFEIHEDVLRLNAKWASLEERMKAKLAKNLPMDLNPLGRLIIEDMQANAGIVLPMPAAPQLDFYEKLERKRRQQLQEAADAEGEGEEEEENLQNLLDAVGDDFDVDEPLGAPAQLTGAISRFDQLVAAAVAAEAETGEENTEEEARKRIDPARIKRILDATGIPMSVQALAAFGLISAEIAWQLREDERERMLTLQGHPHHHRKYTPKQKRATILLEQMRAPPQKLRGGGKPLGGGGDGVGVGVVPSRDAMRSALTSANASETTFESSEEEDEDEEEEEPEAPRPPRKRHTVVTGVDPSTGKEILEVESDSSDESSDEHALEDLQIVEERKLAEEAIAADEEEASRYEHVSRSLAGNLTWKLYTPSLVFYPQTALYSVQQIRAQQVLLEAEIRKLQETLNDKFHEAKAFKEGHSHHVASRNQRIAEIYAFFGKQAPTFDYDWRCHCEDETAAVFEVKDTEVPYERTDPDALEVALAEEETKRREEEQARDAELLEMRMNDELLKKRTREVQLRDEIPKPEFMVRKEQWEWNYDEYIKADEYFHAVEKHEKLRNGFKHELASELRKLLRQNRRSRRLVDAAMHALLTLKILTERCIRMEELKWARLQSRLFEYFRLLREFDQKKQRLVKEQTKLKFAQGVAAQLLTRVEEASRHFEEILERDRSLELSFREDMGRDVNKFHLEQFVKLYHKRPKLTVPRSQLLAATQTMIAALRTPNLRWFAHEHGELGQRIVNAIYEFDNPALNPPACPRTIWERFVHIRRERLLCEYEAKTLASDLLRLQAALEESDDRLEELSDNLAGVLSEVATSRQLILDLVHNVELQIVMRNGQVELPRTLTYEDFANVVLIPEEGMASGNSKISTEGGEKLKTLRNIKRVHSQLKQTEYKLKRAKLKEKHLRLHQQDIQQMRVSKEILEFLRAKDFHSFKHEQDLKLARVAEFSEMADKFHSRSLRTQRRLATMFKRLATRKEEENETKDKYLDERNLQVNMELNSVVRQDPEATAKFHEERVRMLMQLGTMMRTVARHAETICQLETDLDRLYHKTFPVL